MDGEEVEVGWQAMETGLATLIIQLKEGGDVKLGIRQHVFQEEKFLKIFLTQGKNVIR